DEELQPNEQLTNQGNKKLLDQTDIENLGLKRCNANNLNGIADKEHFGGMRNPRKSQALDSVENSKGRSATDRTDRSLVLQLQSISEELCQVAASVLRNLSWHADAASKRHLRDAGAVQMLTQTMLTVKKEPTLKSLLSALWNFSAHCPENKEDICAIHGALQLLVW
ncbi:hypothetical protein ACDT12_13815, partial [Staphylococcus aureus]